ncbi:glutamate-gated chloride channel-like isoform X2 [Varroa jacobsoni]|uniref:glutamate-gated chloride channel-like isoform X2 n=1 Tax=Varroa jacobsoni TaxID=62625 RepID=UPI000BF51708|nr:glutamate-gated chloride channel-like isoform X2 [Varroa jacobsoni]
MNNNNSNNISNNGNNNNDCTSNNKSNINKLNSKLGDSNNGHYNKVKLPPSPANTIMSVVKTDDEMTMMMGATAVAAAAAADARPVNKLPVFQDNLHKDETLRQQRHEFDNVQVNDGRDRAMASFNDLSFTDTTTIATSDYFFYKRENSSAKATVGSNTHHHHHEHIKGDQTNAHGKALRGVPKSAVHQFDVAAQNVLCHDGHETSTNAHTWANYYHNNNHSCYDTNEKSSIGESLWCDLMMTCSSYRRKHQGEPGGGHRRAHNGYFSISSITTNRLLLSLAGMMTLGTMLNLVDARPPDSDDPNTTKVATHQFMNYTDKQILDYLVNNSRYDHRIRPEETTKVNVSVLLLSMSSPDESSLKYEIEFLLIQKWMDQRLAYHETGANHSHLNGLLHEGKIWKPDIYFIKHGEFKTPLNPVHMSLRLYPNGTVVYTMRRHMTLVCQGNLQIFPFDNPKCPFAVESMSYEDTQLKIDWSEEDENITRASSLRALNAYLAKNETGYCDKRHTWRGNYSCLRVLLVFTRDKSFYISTVFVPGIVLVTSSFISFWLDINAVPARVMIGVTTMLNFCTTTNSFRSTLPVVSNLTAMNLWDGVCMFFIYASMLEFVIVNYLYRNLGQHQRHRRYSYASSVASKNHPQATPLLAQQNNKHNVYVKGNESTQKTETTTFVVDPPAGEESNRSFGRFRTVATLFVWLRRPQAISTQLPSKPRLAKAIDYFSRTVFPVLFGMFTFGFFLNYAIIGPLSEENWKLIEY